MIERLWLDLVYGRATPPRPYEAACIAAMRDRLDTEAAAILDTQLAAFDHLQRWSDDKLVVFTPTHDPARRGFRPFANTSDELHAAVVKLKAAQRGRSLQCRIVFAAGRLSSLEFTKPPRATLGDGFEVMEVELVADPTVARQQRRASSAMGPLSGMVARHAALADRLEPADDGSVAALTELVAGAVPADLLGLVRESDGFRIGTWVFHGTRPRSIVWPQATYWLFAEDRGYALALRSGASAADVLYLDQVNEEATSMGPDFVPALIRAIERPAGEEE